MLRSLASVPGGDWQCALGMWHVILVTVILLVSAIGEAGFNMNSACGWCIVVRQRVGGVHDGLLRQWIKVLMQPNKLVAHGRVARRLHVSDVFCTAWDGDGDVTALPATSRRQASGRRSVATLSLVL